MKPKLPTLLRSVAACAVLTTSVVALSQPMERPVFKAGDGWEWVVRDTRTHLQIERLVLTVVETGSEIRLRSGDEASPSVIWDTDGRTIGNTKTGLARRYRSGTTPWPITVGSKWNTDYEWVSSSGQKGRTTEELEVTAFEEVTVPAGTFKAFKVINRGYYTNFSSGGSGAQTRTTWTVPQLLVPVKIVYDDGRDKTTSELVQYKVDDATPK